MDDTKKILKESNISRDELEIKLNDFYRLLLGLNAFGSLDLTDLRVIESFLKGTFHFVPIDVDYEK